MTSTPLIKTLVMIATLAVAALTMGAAGAGTAMADPGPDTGPPGTSTAARAAAAGDQSIEGLSADQKQLLDRRVATTLKRTTGGERVSVNQIAWEGGDVVLTLPVPGARMEVTGSDRCESKHVCLYTRSIWRGAELNFYTCAFRKLRHYGWTNVTSSWANHQTGGATSTLAYWNGSSVRQLETLLAGWAQSFGGIDGVDNRADFIYVC